LETVPLGRGGVAAGLNFYNERKLNMTFIYICISVLVVAALVAVTAIQRIIVVDGREALLYRGGR
jgi:uncharacterized membrane protein